VFGDLDCDAANARLTQAGERVVTPVMKRGDLVHSPPGLHPDRFAEELHPRIKVASNAYLQKVVLVLLPARFQPGRNVQHWQTQFPLTGKLQHTYKAAKAAIAVVEWMQSLELVVPKRHFHEDRYSVVCIDPLDQVAQPGSHLITGRCRHEACLMHTTSAGADEHLRGTDLTRLGGVAAG